MYLSARVSGVSLSLLGVARLFVEVPKKEPQNPFICV